MTPQTIKASDDSRAQAEKLVKAARYAAQKDEAEFDRFVAGMLDDVLGHPWGDDELRNSAIKNICRQYPFALTFEDDKEGDHLKSADDPDRRELVEALEEAEHSAGDPQLHLLDNDERDEVYARVAAARRALREYDDG
jgi:hypothetical protein